MQKELHRLATESTECVVADVRQAWSDVKAPCAPATSLCKAWRISGQLSRQYKVTMSKCHLHQAALKASGCTGCILQLYYLSNIVTFSHPQAVVLPPFLNVGRYCRAPQQSVAADQSGWGCRWCPTGVNGYTMVHTAGLQRKFMAHPHITAICAMSQALTK